MKRLRNKKRKASMTSNERWQRNRRKKGLSDNLIYKKGHHIQLRGVNNSELEAQYGGKEEESKEG